MAHQEASHLDYVRWRNYQARLVIHVMSSCCVLVVVDWLYVRFYIPYFLDVVVACAFGTLLLQIPVQRGKMREVRDVWMKAHPSPNEAHVEES